MNHLLNFALIVEMKYKVVIYVKKIFSIICFALLILLSNSVAQANEDIYSVENVSSFAFYATNDYVDIINNNLALVAVKRVDEYKAVLERLKNFVKETKEDKARACIWLAEAIVAERLATLEAYVKFAECYSAGDVKGCNDYNSQISYFSARAAKLRQDFYDKYKF